MRRLVAAALVVPAMLGAAACGGTTTTRNANLSDAQEAVAKVVTDLASAGRRRDAAKICTDLLSRQLQARARARNSDCQGEIRKATEEADDFDLRVLSVRITGPRATARVRAGTTGPVSTYAFVRESGAWRVSDLG